MDWEVINGGLAPVFVPKPRLTGLDYPGVESVLNRTPDIDRDKVFAQIQIMERAALRVFLKLPDED